jgi:hypothetical protein
MDKNIKIRLEVLVIAALIITSTLIFFPFKPAIDATITVRILEQGDTRIQQHIDLRTSPTDKIYYIRTYIEVYNNGWKKAKKWHNYAAANEIADMKAAQRKWAEEARAEIGKAIREFYYGRDER